MADIKYQRLTFARRRSFFSFAVSTRSSLWLGPDHLLCVDFNGYTETYKRFYFRDIQAIAIRETRRRTIWNVILTMPALFCLFGLLVSLGNTGAVIGWSIPIAVFLVPLVFNNIFGTACATQLRTAVQIENLPSLCRIRKTRKVLDQIRPLITAAQGGEIPADVASSWIRDSVVSAETPQNAAGGNAKAPPRLIS